MNFTGMLKDDTLKGKTILITGGGTGLGKSMGKYFMELGSNLIITSRKQDILNETANEFDQHNGKVLAIAGDVRKESDVKNMLVAEHPYENYYMRNVHPLQDNYPNILHLLVKKV